MFSISFFWGSRVVEGCDGLVCAFDCDCLIDHGDRCTAPYNTVGVSSSSIGERDMTLMVLFYDLVVF